MEQQNERGRLSTPEAPAKSSEYRKFEEALKQVLSVPKPELQRREVEYRREREATKTPENQEPEQAEKAPSGS